MSVCVSEQPVFLTHFTLSRFHEAYDDWHFYFYAALYYRKANYSLQRQLKQVVIFYSMAINGL